MKQDEMWSQFLAKTLDELMKMERDCRKANKWFMGNFEVVNDHGKLVKVSLKSFGFYNQILRLDEDPVNYCSGHTISSVKGMHSFLRNAINRIV